MLVLPKLWNLLFIYFNFHLLCSQPPIYFFNKQVYPLFFALYLALSSLIFIFLFPSVYPCLSLFGMVISLLKLVIFLSILLFHHGSIFSLLPFFSPTSFATQRATAIASLFVWVTSSASCVLSLCSLSWLHFSISFDLISSKVDTLTLLFQYLSSKL